MVLDGELDDLPEQSFYLVGNIDEVIAKAVSLKASSSLILKNLNFDSIEWNQK